MLLENGSKGNDVKRLQRLIGIGETGNFGPLTEQKVKDWQTANGLKVDGIVGDKTWALMFPESTPLEKPI